SYRSVSTFNLYFIDFLLWKLYNEKIRGNETKFKEGSLEYKIAQNKELFNTFNFKQLNSKEHLFPQASIITINEDVLH
ncbi:hypothetical protein NL321_30060, partial [Klebsiella pneumoniae]|nr:hypothetical protein [Klebsiella pneumoniae]